jgi:hypothetical protein
VDIDKQIEILERIRSENTGKLCVMFEDPNSDSGPFGISKITPKVAKKDEYPKYFNMPEGFKFVLLTN